MKKVILMFSVVALMFSCGTSEGTEGACEGCGGCGVDTSVADSTVVDSVEVEAVEEVVAE